MSHSLADQYFLKAQDMFFYNGEEALEALHYALSYDDDHLGANCLMGRLCMERLYRYNDAEKYFQHALSVDPAFGLAYYWLCRCYIVTGQTEKAQKVVDHALRLLTVERALIYECLSMIYERRGAYGKAIKAIRVALTHAYASQTDARLRCELNRLKKKRKNRK